jgi:hypothetical protein
MTGRVILFLLAGALAVAQDRIVDGPPNQAPPAPGTSSIAGTVLNDATNEPLKKVQVTLAGPISGQQPSAVTDASGSFAFHKLPAGTYTLMAMREGFDQERGMLLGDSQKQITVTADQNKTAVELRLAPNGAISGRLTDEIGDPAPYCNVSALDAAGNERGQAQTDDHGEYRIANLSAGRYLVAQHCYQTLAAPHPFMERGDPRTPVWAWVPGLYGGADAAAGASSIVVHEGEEVRGIDFRLSTTSAFTVSIAVEPDSPGIDPRNVSVRLMARDPAMARVEQYGVGRTSNGGPMRASGVVPGSYIAVADFQQGEKHWHGEAPVEVEDTPPTLVRLPLTAAMTLTGDLEVAGGNGSPGQVALIPLDSSHGAGYPRTQPGADGNFTISGVIPGRYQLQVMGALNNMESVTFGGHEVSPRAIDIGPGAGGALHVVVNIKQVGVQVSVDGLQADRPASVFLLPKGSDTGPGANPPVMQAQQSPVTIPVTPGDYVAYAVECDQPWPLLNNPALLRAIASMGKAVEVKDGESATVTVSMIGHDDLKRAMDSELQ